MTLYGQEMRIRLTVHHISFQLRKWTGYMSKSVCCVPNRIVPNDYRFEWEIALKEHTFHCLQNRCLP